MRIQEISIRSQTANCRRFRVLIQPDLILQQTLCVWRRRVGIEPTGAVLPPPTVLKTARPTRASPPPWKAPLRQSEGAVTAREAGSGYFPSGG